MAYHYSIQSKKPFNEVVTTITENLKRQGFGIITTIDMKATLKEKLNVDFRDYKILGACNPEFAHKALNLEPQIGVMLPCNVVVRQQEDGVVTVSAVNPMETMDKSLSPDLKYVAAEVSNRLRAAVDELKGEFADTNR
ncbi:MAG: DUF302 domain-containing protein [Chryseosolibacter sp.]